MIFSWNLYNIFDLYQTVHNASINHATISKSNVSANDVVVIIFLSSICLIFIICITKVSVRRCRKRKERDDLQFNKDIILKKTRVKNKNNRNTKSI